MIKKRRVIVTGDLLRLTHKDKVPSQNANIRWLHRLIRRPLTLATGSEPTIMLSDEDFDYKLFYEKCTVDADISGWASLYEQETVTPAALDMILAHFGDALVIGFELNAVFRRAFEQLGIPYIDCVIHPVRFLDDLLFGFTTNVPEIYEALMPMRYDEENMYLAAAAIEAAVVREGPLLPDDISVLAMGQTSDDKTIILDGRLRGWGEFKNTMRELVPANRRVAFKPHPYSQTEVDIYNTGLLHHQIFETNHNFYKLLSQPQIETVVSLSSSTSIEARYFGRKGVHLLKEPFDFAMSEDEGFVRDRYVSVYDQWLGANFWRTILRPVIETTANDSRVVEPSRNRLRISLNAFWGFNEVSIDRMIAPGLRKALAR